MNDKRKKYLATTYLFLILSVVFYVLFFLEPAQERLPVIGCAFLCDLGAGVYLIRSLKE